MFAIVDIETCGAKFAYEKGRIIDICILVHDGIRVVDKFSTLINPDCMIGSFYTNLSGITNEMVKDAPYFHEVAKEILSFTEGNIFVAHNVSFDYNFIKDEFASLGYKFKCDTLCTVRLSRKLLPGKKSYSLGNLCESIGIQITDRHRAEGDAMATSKLLNLLLQLKTQSAEFMNASLAQIMTTRKENIKKYILDKLPACCGVYYFLNQRQEIIYIGKSIDMYVRAQSHFNSDLKKSKSMLHDLYNVDYTETGSELISLLLESQEIKKHKPHYNSARKKDVFTHCIDIILIDGIQFLKIVSFEESTHALQIFTSYASARERLEQWIDEKNLCLRYCGLTDSESVCFHHQLKKCLGICAGLEAPEEYNKRVAEIELHHAYTYANFIIVDKGRNRGEKSFVLIKNNRYVGYGYLEEEAQIGSIDDLNIYLVAIASYPDEDDIIKGWLRQKKCQIIKF